MYAARPVTDPFHLQSLGKRSACPLAFEGTDLVGANAFGKPHGSSNRNFFAEALVEEDLASDAMRNRPA